MTGVVCEFGTPLLHHRQPAQQRSCLVLASLIHRPPVWICPDCQKLMRLRAIEIANGEERIKLACAACGAEAAQTSALSE